MTIFGMLPVLSASGPCWLAVLLVVTYAVVRRQALKGAHQGAWLRFGLFAYSVALLVALAPDTFLWPDHWRTVFGPEYINLVPLRTIVRYSFGTRGFMVNVAGNVLLFIPVGLYVSMLLARPGLLRVACVMGSFAVLVETMQLFSRRVTDIDDVLLNVIGGLLGYALYRVAHKACGVSGQKSNGKERDEHD